MFHDKSIRLQKCLCFVTTGIDSCNYLFFVTILTSYSDHSVAFCLSSLGWKFLGNKSLGYKATHICCLVKGVLGDCDKNGIQNHRLDLLDNTSRNLLM